MLIRAYNRRRSLAVLLAKEQEAQGSQAGDGHTGNGDQREAVRRLRDGCRRLAGRGRCAVGRGVVRRAKLYYLRNLTGKAARIREKR